MHNFKSVVTFSHAPNSNVQLVWTPSCVIDIYRLIGKAKQLHVS